MAASAQPSFGTKPARVLLAEGDKVSLSHLRELLGRTGYAVEVAIDGMHALELLQSENPPTLAVLDWTMPGLSGIEICRKLRNGNRRHNTYVVLLTRWNQQNDRIAALEAGADDCLYKPVDVRELRLQLQAGAQIILGRALRESEERFRSAFEYAGTGMAVVKLTGEFLQMNQSICDCLGYSRDELLTRSVQDVSDPKDSPAFQTVLDEFLKGERTKGDFERKFVQKNGARVHASVTLSLIHDDDKTSTGFVLQLQDITGRKDLEVQLRQAQKLEAIGQLAAGVAHEINTPTQYIGNNIRFLKDSWSSVAGFLNLCGELQPQAAAGQVGPESLQLFAKSYEKCDFAYLLKEIPQAIDQSMDGLQRVAKIVKGMKEFSHPGSEEKRTINLNRAIETTITVSRHEWKYCSNLVTEFDEALPLVPCLTGEFNQVMLNLIINAAHAISSATGESAPQKGTITITTRRDGAWAQIAVADTGTGIPEEVRPRIFEPFFTTKAVGKGTGQGLALSRSVIVNRHQGQIWFESEFGRGTTFFIRLPLDTGVPVS